MTREIRITREDIPLVQEIFDVLVKALESFPEPFIKNDKFGVLAITALINMVCRIAQTTGVSKEELFRTFVKIWDDKVTATKDRTWN